MDGHLRSAPPGAQADVKPVAAPPQNQGKNKSDFLIQASPWPRRPWTAIRRKATSAPLLATEAFKPNGSPRSGHAGNHGRQAGGSPSSQGTSHRPVTGLICPLLAADRTSRAPCSGEAGTEKKMEGRLSGGRNSDRTNPDPIPHPIQHPPVGRRRRPRAKIVAGRARAKIVAGRAPKSSQAARQNRRKPRAKREDAAVNLPRPIACVCEAVLEKKNSRFFRFDRKSQRPCPVLGRTKFQPMSGQAGILTAGLKFPASSPPK
jgi:hypothetical protein